MNQNERDIRRKLRILRHAEQIGTFARPAGISASPRLVRLQDLPAFRHRLRELLSLESSPATPWESGLGKSQARAEESC
jgi:hypothetical protein